MHRSVPMEQCEFLDLSPLDINPLMASCTIKVLYTGENRNRSAISKEVAAEMAKTLRGAPIVGYYKKDKEDFADHGEIITIDDDGIHFDTLTVPYGFISPDAKVWFQTFEDYDENGAVTERTYLVTNGYLWVGQFEEAKKAYEQGQPQSMELDKDTIDGDWELSNQNFELFVIKDATFSKLCILGQDVEPCFEGASIEKDNTHFNLQKNTLFKMMQDLTFALQGGQSHNMEDVKETVVEEVQVEEAFSLDKTDEILPEENEITVETPETSVDFVKKDDEEEEKKEEDSNEESDSKEDSSNSDKEEDEEEKKKKFSLQEDYDKLKSSFNELTTAFEELQSKYSAANIELESLRNFKAEAEDKEKDALIAKFFMLSDEDKADVIANKRNYSLEQIESKLSIAYVRSDSNFLTGEVKKENTEPQTIFNLESVEQDNLPAWLKAVEDYKNMKN